MSGNSPPEIAGFSPGRYVRARVGPNRWELGRVTEIRPDGYILITTHTGFRIPIKPSQAQPAFLVVCDLNGVLGCRMSKWRFVRRPNLDRFLRFLFANFVVAVWTSGMEAGGRQIIKQSFGHLESRLLFSLFRDDCTPCATEERPYATMKDLANVWSKYGDMCFDHSNTIIIDDSDDKCSHRFNALCPMPFDEPQARAVIEMLGEAAVDAATAAAASGSAAGAGGVASPPRTAPILTSGQTASSASAAFPSSAGAGAAASGSERIVATTPTVPHSTLGVAGGGSGSDANAGAVASSTAEDAHTAALLDNQIGLLELEAALQQVLDTRSLDPLRPLMLRRTEYIREHQRRAAAEAAARVAEAEAEKRRKEEAATAALKGESTDSSSALKGTSSGFLSRLAEMELEFTSTSSRTFASPSGNITTTSGQPAAAASVPPTAPTADASKPPQQKSRLGASLQQLRVEEEQKREKERLDKLEENYKNDPMQMFRDQKKKEQERERQQQQHQQAAPRPASGATSLASFMQQNKIGATGGSSAPPSASSSSTQQAAPAASYAPLASTTTPQTQQQQQHLRAQQHHRQHQYQQQSHHSQPPQRQQQPQYQQQPPQQQYQSHHHHHHHRQPQPAQQAPPAVTAAPTGSNTGGGSGTNSVSDMLRRAQRVTMTSQGQIQQPQQQQPQQQQPRYQNQQQQPPLYYP